MSKDREIYLKMRELFQAQPQLFPATVVKVDPENMFCTVKDIEGMEYFNVRLRAVIDAKQVGFYAVPAEDSQVLVGKLHNNDATLSVLQYSDIDTVRLDNGKYSLEINDEGIIMNGGDRGLGIIDPIIDKINELTEKFVSHFHGIGNPNTTTPLEEPAEAIVILDLEEDKVVDPHVTH